MPPRRPTPPSGPQLRVDRERAAALLAEALTGPAQTRADTIARLGGPAAVAGIVGRSVRTVQRWAAGSIKAPKADAVAKLNRADVQDRMARRGINVDRATNQPRRPVQFQARGHVTVKGPGRSPEYGYDRRIGAEGGLELDPALVAGMAEQYMAGNNEGALQLLERDLTSDYANCGDNYDPDAGLGFRFDSLQEASFYTDAAGDPLFP